MRKAELPIVRTGDTLLRALQVIDKAGFEVALVVEDDMLLGLLTDGDCRRAIIRGIDLDAPIAGVMQTRFTSVPPELDRAEVLDIMKARSFEHLPVVDPSGRLLGLHLLHDLLGMTARENLVVLLCGGLGTRLMPLTATTPKPMIRVAGRPILERTILQLMGYGFRRFRLAVHYLADQVTEHFGDGAALGCEIEYLREQAPLGTGGALGLLDDPLVMPLLVMNGDVLAQFNAGAMMDAHVSNGHMITVGAHEYFHQIPFGVLDVEGGRLQHLSEKPSFQHLVNAGIYTLDARVVARVARGTAITLPDIIQQSIAAHEPVGIYRLDGDWIDVGRHEELQRARGS